MAQSTQPSFAPNELNLVDDVYITKMVSFECLCLAASCSIWLYHLAAVLTSYQTKSWIGSCILL